MGGQKLSRAPSCFVKQSLAYLSALGPRGAAYGFGYEYDYEYGDVYGYGYCYDYGYYYGYEYGYDYGYDDGYDYGGFYVLFLMKTMSTTPLRLYSREVSCSYSFVVCY
jgi:hypothetical protein